MDLIPERRSKHNVSFMAIGSRGRRFESSRARHVFALFRLFLAGPVFRDEVPKDENGHYRFPFLFATRPLVKSPKVFLSSSESSVMPSATKRFPSVLATSADDLVFSP